MRKLSYIQSKDLARRNDIENKEIESSRDKVLGKNRHRHLVKKKQTENFIHQDYVSVQLLDTAKQSIIIGNPGVGKTTFARWLCYKWSKGETSQDYVPIFVSLRELIKTGSNCILAFLKSKCPKHTEQELTEGLQQNYDKIIWMLDGYDELTASEQANLIESLDKIYMNVPYRGVLLMRPYGLINLSGFEPDVMIQLDGLNELQIKDYIYKFAAYNQSEKTDAQNLIDIIEENSVLSDYAHTPMMLSYITWIYFNDENKRAELKTVENNYKLQNLVFAIIQERESSKKIASELKAQIKNKDKIAFSYDLLMDKKFVKKGNFIDEDKSLIPRLFAELNIGTFVSDTSKTAWAFYFNSVTFQEFFATECIYATINTPAFNYLLKDKFFINFTNLIIGALINNNEIEKIEDILSVLKRDLGKNNISLYLFLNTLAECNRRLVNDFLDEATFGEIWTFYLLSGQYNIDYRTLMINSLRRLYNKMNEDLKNVLIENIVSGINPIPYLTNKNNSELSFDVTDAIKLMIIDLSLFNNPIFIDRIVEILEIAALTLKKDENFDIYAHEPVAFIIEDILSRTDIPLLRQYENRIKKSIKALPDIYIGSATHLEAIFEEKIFSIQALEAPLEALKAKIKKLKRWDKSVTERTKNKIFDDFKDIASLLYKSSFTQMQAVELREPELRLLRDYFDLAYQILEVASPDLDEFDVEEVFQLTGEGVSIYKNDTIYQLFMQLALVVRPSYSGVNFYDIEHFKAWYVHLLQSYINTKQKEGFLMATYALSMSDNLQLHFIQFCALYGQALETYIQENKYLLTVTQNQYVVYKDGETPEGDLDVLKPLNLLIELGRNASDKWAESNKKFILDIVFKDEIRQIKHIQDSFIPNLINYDFNLFQEHYWDFIDSYIQQGKVEPLFNILRNRKIFSFPANLKHLKHIWNFVLNNTHNAHFKERMWLIIELASRTLVLIFKYHEHPDYEKQSYELIDNIYSWLKTDQAKQAFLQEETQGALTGIDMAAFVLCYAFKQKPNLKVVSDYCHYFKPDKNVVRREFIVDITNLLLTNKGIDMNKYEKIKPVLGKKMVNVFDDYINEKGYDFVFSKIEFEAFMNG